MLMGLYKQTMAEGVRVEHQVAKMDEALIDANTLHSPNNVFPAHIRFKYNCA